MRPFHDLAPAGQAHFYSLSQALDAGLGQSTGVTQAHRAYQRIRFGAILIPVTAKSFRLRQQLRVYLQPDYRFVF